MTHCAALTNHSTVERKQTNLKFDQERFARAYVSEGKIWQAWPDVAAMKSCRK